MFDRMKAPLFPDDERLKKPVISLWLFQTENLADFVKAIFTFKSPLLALRECTSIEKSCFASLLVLGKHVKLKEERCTSVRYA